MSSEHEQRARRDFMRLAIAVLPAGSLLSGCGSDFPVEPEAEQQELQTDACADIEQRTRWQQLHDAYVGRKNLHDLQGLVDSFSTEGELVINDLPPFVGSRAIAEGHRLFGFSREPSALANTQVIPEREYFTSDELLIEGRILGIHAGELLGYRPSLLGIELHYAGFYRFDLAGKLVSERIVMNWAPLASGGTSTL